MNIGSWISKRAGNWPERLMLAEESGREITNRGFNARVNQTAHWLAAQGASRGERVALLLDNSPFYLELLFACAKIGAILVPLNTRLTPPELEYILGDCSPRVMVHGSRFADTVRALRPETTAALCHQLDQPPCLAGTPGAAPVADHEPDAALAPGLADPLLIMYTSGTTGDPKGAVLSHGNLLFGAIHSLLGFGLGASCRSLVVAPLYHIGALAASVLPVVYVGGALVMSPFDNPSAVLERIVRQGITYMFAVPVMFEMLTRSPRWAEADLSAVELLITGGAPMPAALIRRYQQEKGVGFVQGYGMTETGRLTALDLEDAVHKAGSVGKAVFHTDLRIVAAHGGEAGEGETGEVVVRGPTVFDRYWNQPLATAAAIRDGWFHTGDLGRRDAEGFIYLNGRKTDVIISSAQNIYAAEVERAIETLPQVSLAAVVAMPDARRGEVPAAFVQLKAGQCLSEAQLMEALADRLAPFKIPRKIIFVEEFPRNGAGKILKRLLKADLAAQGPTNGTPEPLHASRAGS
jgi:fatty-acyl-CoA synthase